jgi:probable F420-dependent oxidoreductase
VELGTFGVWASNRAVGEEHAGEAAKLAEDLGYGTFWLGGSPRLREVRPLLEATDRLIAGTSIVNVWQYEPDQLAAEHAEITREFPERVVLGIGIGHPEATGHYARPLATMRNFIDGLDGAPAPVPPEELCISALGPKMLALCAQRSRGTLPYFVPVEHTRWAREQLGPDPLLATEVACVIEPDADRGREVARRYAQLYLGLSNYTGNLLRFDYTEDDLRDGGSDRLIDAVVPHGSVGEVAAALRAHLDAGADHVCVQPVGATGIPRADWTALAAELIGQ